MSLFLDDGDEDLLFEALQRAPEVRTDYLRGACRGQEQYERILAKLEMAQRAGELFPDAAPAAHLEDPVFSNRERFEDRPDQIGGYAIRRILGRGGMGTVYLAQQPLTERDVALKTIRFDLLQEQRRDFIAQLGDEIRALGQLQHEAIARIYGADHFEYEGETLSYFVMEYVAGEDIKTYVESRKLERREIVKLLLQVAQGLEHAHEKGIVHRDLKPRNIFVDPEGSVKILDFGVAKVLSSSRYDGFPNDKIAAGTFRYMSPEQIRGSSLDARTDVYSFGILAHELLCGDYPFTIDAADMTRSKLEIEVQLDDQGDELRSILERCLKEDPEARYPSIQALSEDLARFLDRYRIIERIGDGGMGIVYLAVQKDTGRNVALKKIKPELRRSHDELFTDRFRREIETLAKLNHPAIAQIFDAGTIEEKGVRSPYFTMEHISGLGLREFRLERQTDSRAKLEILIQIARGLHHAHQRGIIHLDLNPRNVMIDEHHRPKILDFGVARSIKDVDQKSMESDSAALGGVVYRSPEQLSPQTSGEAVDVRTDVYSFGILAHEFLTGRYPFQVENGESESDTAREPIDVQSVDGLFAGDIEAILTKCLQVGPGGRYDSMSEVADELQRVLDDRPVESRTPSYTYRFQKFSRRRTGTVAALVFAALMFIGVVVGFVAATIWANEATAWAKEADERREEALSLHGVALYEELEREGDQFWPRRGSLVEPMNGWLHRANELSERIPQYERHIISLTHAYDRLSREERWLLQRLEGLVRTLKDELPGQIDEVEANRLVAKSIEIETIDKHRDAWEEAIHYIRHNYDGLELSPISGLVPLGVDPESGFYEFWHYESGSEPAWDETGIPNEGEGIVLVLLPGGEFRMGHMSTMEMGNHPRRMYLSPFLIAKGEMTQGQWIHLTGDNPSKYKDQLVRSKILPVERVSLVGAQTVLWRYGLSIPSEVQWEYAAKGGCCSPWGIHGLDDGDDVDRSVLAGYANLADKRFGRWATRKDVENWSDGSYITTYAGKLKPNYFGLHHMVGNVWEWCRDRFQPGGTGLDDLFVFRGGSFECKSDQANLNNRRGESRLKVRADIGVRPIMELPSLWTTPPDQGDPAPFWQFPGHESDWAEAPECSHPIEEPVEYSASNASTSISTSMEDRQPDNDSR